MSGEIATMTRAIAAIFAVPPPMLVRKPRCQGGPLPGELLYGHGYQCDLQEGHITRCRVVHWRDEDPIWRGGDSEQ